MNKTGKVYSKAAVAGFILAVAPVALFLLLEFIDLFIHFHSMGFNKIYAYSVIAGGVLSIVFGWIFSITGLISSIRNNLKGKGLAITAIVFFAFETMVAFVALARAIAK